MDTLEDLVNEVEEHAVSAEPLDLIAAAMGTKADLDDLGAGLTRQTVLTALHEGDGRPDRGRHRRVSFSAPAKRALELALANASRLGHNYIGTEHILLALFDVADGKAAQILADAGVTKDAV